MDSDVRPTIHPSLSSVSTGNVDDGAYHEYLQRIQHRMMANLSIGPLVTTDADLWPLFLEEIPEAERQFHTCSACRHFIQRYGGLAVIHPNGSTRSALWMADDAYGLYEPAAVEMADAILHAKVTGVFETKHAILGQPETGAWRHFSLTIPDQLLHRDVTKTAGQAMAAKLQDYLTVMTALKEYSFPVLQQAVRLLRSETLYRAEKVLGQAEWLADLQARFQGAHGRLRSNILWRAVALAPAGFCHPKSSMVGTLLDDLASGKTYEEVASSFKVKMDPLRYQRPVAAPSEGAIVQAERIVEQMGIRLSLERRFARLDELQLLWAPPAVIQSYEKHGGVFEHLRPSAGSPATTMDIPAVTMTWEKFARTILPTAELVEYYAPNVRRGYMAFVTAVHPDAPPILQWDRQEQRNPVSSYVWNHGALPTDFGVASHTWHQVDGVSTMPSHWYGQPSHHHEAICLVIRGMRDKSQDGNALFPEILKAELHSVRSVIEAYAKEAVIAGKDEPMAAGLAMVKGPKSDWKVQLRVTANGQRSEYVLDRWD